VSNKRPVLDASKSQKLVGALPRGVAVTNAVNGAGKRYFRVRLGKKFTGGKPIVRCFPNLNAAREWIFGCCNAESNSNASDGIVAAAGCSWNHCSAVTRDGWRWIVDAGSYNVSD
jgi:hypothetical protein